MVKKSEGEILSQKAYKAIKKAVRGVIADRKMRGEPLIIWKNGKVVKVPANQSLQRQHGCSADTGCPGSEKNP